MNDRKTVPQGRTKANRKSDDSAKRAFVYIIRCDFSDRVYVGKTCDPDKRLKKHFSDARRGSKTMLHRVMRRHPPDSFHLEIVEEHPTEEKAYLGETRLIERLRAEGRSIFNLNDGGTGQRNPTEETRTRMSNAQLGKKASEETRTKLSEQRRGKPKPESQRAKLRLRRGKMHSNYGKKIHTEEQKAEWRANRVPPNKGKPMPQEQRNAISTTKRARGSAAGPANPRWKGDDASPRTIRERIKKEEARHAAILRANFEPAPVDSWL